MAFVTLVDGSLAWNPTKGDFGLPPAVVPPSGTTPGTTPLPDINPNVMGFPPASGSSSPSSPTNGAGGDPCVSCGITNVGACLTCFLHTAETYAIILAALLLGVYLLFRPEINQAAKTASKAAVL